MEWTCVCVLLDPRLGRTARVPYKYFPVKYIEKFCVNVFRSGYILSRTTYTENVMVGIVL